MRSAIRRQATRTRFRPFTSWISPGNETASFAPSPDDVYVAPEMSWTGDGKSLCFLLLDRPQTHLDVFLLGRAGGAPKKLLSESDPAWINAIEPPHFLKDGSFVFLSERSGFFHLYRHAADGSLRNAITKGDVDGRRPVDRRREDGYRLV